MNWARVKTILIVVFLLINIFLIIKVNDKYGSKSITQGEITSLKNLISQKGIILNSVIPPKIYYLQRMKIVNKIIDEQAAADKFLGQGKWKSVLDKNNKTVYSAGNTELEFDKYGFAIIKTGLTKEEFLQISDKNKAAKAVLNITKRFVPIQNYSFDFYYQVKESKIVAFTYYEKDSEMFNNYLIATVQQDDKITLKVGSVDFAGFSSKSKKVTAIDALVEFIRVVKDKKDISIEQISIGYYLNLNRGNEIIKSGEADPVWKVKTNKGVYIFDGYTGNLLIDFGEENGSL